MLFKLQPRTLKAYFLKAYFLLGLFLVVRSSLKAFLMWAQGHRFATEALFDLWFKDYEMLVQAGSWALAGIVVYGKVPNWQALQRSLRRKWYSFSISASAKAVLVPISDGFLAGFWRCVAGLSLLIFGALFYLEVPSPRVLWEPVVLSRVGISFLTFSIWWWSWHFARSRLYLELCKDSRSLWPRFQILAFEALSLFWILGGALNSDRTLWVSVLCLWLAAALFARTESMEVRSHTAFHVGALRYFAFDLGLIGSALAIFGLPLGEFRSPSLLSLMPAAQWTLWGFDPDFAFWFWICLLGFVGHFHHLFRTSGAEFDRGFFATVKSAINRGPARLRPRASEP